ncbi:MAG: T9SS type A sorting domain-containing protein [Flavobacteriales bacterium]|nr:T9SS type A sorting domain-containing protein [Flavobacteriales bacterium]
MRKTLYILFTLTQFATTFAQTSFEISLDPINISNLGGIQSFAFGQHDGKWLIIGGRLDGLHRRQPFASFDVAGNNNKLIVIDPVAQKSWSAPLTSLSVALQEQLSSTNMEFHQEGTTLYIIGGYGYNNASASRKTFNNLTAVDVPMVIDAIINNKTFTSYFRQVSDNMFAITGGHLKKIDSTYYLLGGNKFDGNYNPMGNATYTQVYTDAIYKFKIIDTDTSLSFSLIETMKDAANLHRRDYNAVSQIMPNGAEGITMFSGVFQPNVDLPFLNCVNVDNSGYKVNNDFNQYYNHYHCAVLPAYSKVNNEMHTIFFGGIAQYYDSAEVLIKDDDVPFVKTIARITRDENGTMTEYKLPIEMPQYLGASAEFIPVQTAPYYSNEVLKLDNIGQDSVLVGYIFGGISSSDKNIFFINSGTQSQANSVIYAVYLTNNDKASIDKPINKNLATLKMSVNPNPVSDKIEIAFVLHHKSDVNIILFDANGKMVEQQKLANQLPGSHTFSYKLSRKIASGVYFITLESDREKVTQKIVVQ